MPSGNDENTDIFMIRRTLHHRWRRTAWPAMSWAAWPARTSHVLRGLAHVAESPSQRQDYVAAQRVVPRLGMIVS